MDYVDFLHPYSYDPTRMLAPAGETVVGADAVDRWTLRYCLSSELCKSRAAYEAYEVCAAFLAFLDSPRSVVDLALLGCYQWTVFSASAWGIRQPLDSLA